MEALNCTDLELSIYLQALEEDCLPISSLDTSQSEPSKSIHIASKVYRAGRKTVTFHGFRSLMTLPSLTEGGSGDSLTLLPEDSLVKISLAPEKERGSMVPGVGYGDKWRELSVRYDPCTSSWKTHRCLFQEDLPESSVILPKEGMMQGGCIYQRMTSVRPTRGTGYGWLPTPSATPYGSSQNGCPGDGRLEYKGKGKPSLNTMARKNTWPTPTAQDGNGRTYHNQRDGSKTASLLGKVQSFPTPSATPYGTSQNGCPGDGRLEYKGKGKPSLDTMARKNNWPTPTAQDGRNNGSISQQKRNTPPLNAVVEMFPTPTSSMVTAGDMEQSRFAGNDPRRPTYSEASKTFPTPTKSDGTGGPGRSKNREGGDNLRTTIGGRLNPDWVELLMGWPKRWSSLEPLISIDEDWYHWPVDWEKDITRTAVNQANRTSRLKAIGNGQVPLCAATAWTILRQD